MNIFRRIQDWQRPWFEKGGRFEKLYPLYEAQDTFLFTPGHVTRSASHVRDAIDLKRIMTTVVVALIPCIFMAMYNTGLQANLAMAPGAGAAGWRGTIMHLLGVGYDPRSLFACTFQGALYFIPALIVTYVAGGICEVIFAVIRKHDVNEGFLVTGMLFPLILPPTIPLWQVALGIAFGVVIGKEIFGGTGMNILNPALTARAFLFFAYPAQISGDLVWIAVNATNQVDGFSGATVLGRLAAANAADPNAIPQVFQGMGLTWWDAFAGLEAGSMGETSALACLLGAVILILTGIGSWRIMAGGVVGTIVFALLLNAVGSEKNVMMTLPFYWHFVLGGWAFGLVFMATDPVSGTFTETGKWIYGFCIGALCTLIRVVNPAYPEGMMLAILFMNMFAPLIDHIVVSRNVKRRLARSAV
ncbi:MAG: NADH:ubiquinone reductase (Na(+)-transporting) subunit B [Candidatus Hydrogenedentes bacterium]|nr:NADH:ubiquinone reductase (Na(+)-transporting) subunit B [Candidatus Hydrogenedentota bacterium]MBI3118997.1 NADH:ubiquinone reductase (Na(+)-transporting) subunit B [Candidatus Hydrogenedentota bacterium]